MTREELVYNEKQKLSATCCNTLAASCVTVGVLTPLVTLVINPMGMLASDDRWSIAGAILLSAVGFGFYLHLVARRFLEHLTQ